MIRSTYSNTPDDSSSRRLLSNQPYTLQSKGVTGDVVLTMTATGATTNLTDGASAWRMAPGLGGEARGLSDPATADAFKGWRYVRR